MALVFSAIFLFSSAALANNTTVAVSPSPDGEPQIFNGEVSAGGSQSFTYKAADHRDVLFAIDADNETCGAELRRDTERGYMPNFESFPTTRAETVAQGETLKISFFQTRLAALHQAPCIFSLTIK
ncbi:hypothetical protein ACLE20_14310 [Rhizobium sp. YIM 134829]|uniref:hypothetical protein n=1 Tax=Rhizobium sp. YIM 134829 TaxID=3390453 RepID=UPI0039782CC1